MQSQKFESELQPVLASSALRLTVHRLVVGTIAALSAIATEGLIASAQAALTNWNFDPVANQLEITVKDGTTPRYFLMAQPARIVVDFPDAAIGDVSVQKTYAGAVRQIRVSQSQPGQTRIVMEISPNVALAPGQVKLQKVEGNTAQSGNSRWRLSPLITKTLSANAVSPRSPVDTKPTASTVATSIASKPAAPTAPSNAPTPVKPSALISPTAVTPPDAPKPVAPAVTSPNNPSTQPQRPAPTGSIPAPPAEKDSPQAPPSSVEATTANEEQSSTSEVVATKTAPTSARPIDLAPVLPSSLSVPSKTTAPPPLASLPTGDSTLAVDTTGGVAIAVPTPTVTPTNKPSNTVTVPAIATSTPPQPITSPQAVATPATPASAPRSPSTRIDSLLALARPTPAATGSASADDRSSAPSVLTLAAMEIPTTVAAATAPAPTVSVPPLAPQKTAPTPLPASPAIAQPKQNAAEFAPPSPLLPTVPNNQPASVSVPPIRVGTPSLGIFNGAPPAVEAAPPYLVSPSSAPPPSVSVPSFQPPATITPPSGATTSYDANTIRREPSNSQLAPPVIESLQQTVAPSAATPTYDANTIIQPPVSPAPTPVVEFGQPLPLSSGTGGVGSQPSSGLVNPSPGVRQALKPAAPNVLLPVGAILNLRYPGNEALNVRTDSPQQEVFVLQTEIRDVAGNVLAPEGSLVTGRFETVESGSRFVAQAISLSGRSFSIAAQSEPLGGTRKVADTNLVRNSGIGIVAGGVLGAIGGSAGLGAIGGAAAGATATFLTAPKPATIQPGQIIQVRLTQDLQ